VFARGAQSTVHRFPLTVTSQNEFVNYGKKECAQSSEKDTSIQLTPKGRKSAHLSTACELQVVAVRSMEAGSKVAMKQRNDFKMQEMSSNM
jgi:hypothetical protein